ncbi:MAG: nitroreductase [Bacteroidales bacterium]|nr:nitroreductase [Bacteroidales bacterium]
MSFLELVSSRQSVRAFDPKRSVEKEKLDRVIEAARLAPSACNAQPWSFVLVDEPELKNKIADATSTRVLGLNHFTKQAPVHLLLVEEKVNISSGVGGWIKKKDYAQMDLGIVAAHIVLAAQEEGLGTCIVGWFDEDKVKDLLHIPSSKRVWLDIVIGYSTQPLRKKNRKSVDKILSYNRYK